MPLTYSDGTPLTRLPIFLGVDFGQSVDYTAIIALEQHRIDDDFCSWHLRYLQRLPLGTPYPDQVTFIAGLMTKLKPAEVKLIVDETGVGRPVTDMLRKAGLKPIPVTITAGHRVIFEHGYRVPKRDLVSAVQVVLQSKRLKIASSLPLANVLTDELLNFKVNINERGHDSYGAGDDTLSWRERDHDDTVLATALAVWYGERTSRLTKNESSRRVYAKAMG
jgi:hypothetical protein